MSVLPAEQGSEELESVTIFPLVKPYRPALWTQAAEELDGVAERLAKSLGGELQHEPRTVRRRAFAGGCTRSATSARASSCASG